jgi:hypothetical protein
MTDDELRAAYARTMRDRRPPGPACVTLEAILALVQQHGTEEDRLATLEHVMSCATCRHEFDVLRVAHTADTEIGSRSALGAWRPRPTLLALAASVVVAVGIGLVERARRDSSPAIRGSPSELTPGAVVTSAPVDAPVTLAWHPAPNALRYTLEVLRAEGSVAITAVTSETTLVITPRRLPPGDYRWWVRALERDGSEPRSPVRALRLHAP